MNSLRFIAAVAIALAATGCVSKIAENRVQSALVRAGLSDANSRCMARRMVDRLTIRQLKKLEALKGEKRSIADYVAAVRRVNDAKAIEVTVSSAVLCTTGFAR